jgi:subtilisin family serine protease
MKMRSKPYLVLILLLLLGLFAALPAGAQVTPFYRHAKPDTTVEIDPELLARFQAGENPGYLIYFRERADLAPAYEMDWEARGQFVMETLQATAEASQKNVRAYLDGQAVEYKHFWIDNVIAVESSPLATLSELLVFSEIASIEPRREVYLFDPVETENDLENILQAIEPNLIRVKAPDVWGMGITGQGITVASIDTGVRYTHDALVNQYRGNLGGNTFDHNYQWWNPYAASSAPSDSDDHGSHVTGTMVGDDGDSNQIGMAPGAKWIACRGFNPSATDAGLLECAQFLTAPWNLSGANPNPAMRPHVINNSWGSCGQPYDPWYQGVVDAWVAAGIYPVFANGNQRLACPVVIGSVGTPARYGNVTGVGALGQNNGTLASYSLWGPSDVPDTINPRGYPFQKPQVSAPGTNRSALRGSDIAYGFSSGTSMAAPHVAGLVALMWEAAPCLIGDYSTTETIIEETAASANVGGSYPGHPNDGPGGVPNQATGWGEIDALAAVQEAMGIYCPTGALIGLVTDSDTGAPLAGVDIVVTDNDDFTKTAVTDADGEYVVTYVPEGSYDVTAQKFGYLSQTTTGIEIEEDETTTLDFELELAPISTVSGVVTDDNTGWPLYAQLSVMGVPGGPFWSDPETGAYSITLPQGMEYTFTVNAWVAGYLPEVEVLTPAFGMVDLDFGLEANPVTCNAPGYQLGLNTIFAENFDSVTPPALPSGWAKQIVSGTNPDWQTRTSTRYPSGHPPHSTPNLIFFNSFSVTTGGSIRLFRTVDLDLSAATAPQIFFWVFHDPGFAISNDRIQVQVSTNAGATWTNVGDQVSRYRPTIHWAEHSRNLSAYAGMSNVRVGFLATSGYGNDTHMDTVSIADTPCIPPTGGLVVGNVYDENTGAELTGAVVEGPGGATATALATPLDPNVDDAFYTIFAPAGSATLTATFGSQYDAAVANLTIVDGTTQAYDFDLSAGWLAADPDEIFISVELGSTDSTTFDLNNLGNAAVNWEISERDEGYMPFADEQILVVRQEGLNADAMQAALTALGYTYLGVTDAVFRTIPVSELLEYQAVFYAGAAPVDSLPFLTAYLDAGGSLLIADNDLGFFRGTTAFYQEYLQATYIVDDAGDFLTGEDLMAGLDLDITPDPFPDGFTVGAEAMRLFKYTTNDYAGGSAIERMDYRAIYLSFDMHRVAGTEDRDELVSRILGFLVDGDVPWMSASPITGTLSAALGTQLITVEFDASIAEVPEPGIYSALMRVNNDTPYGRLDIPVTMNVTSGPTLGKVEGVVQSQGYCDNNPFAIAGAEVVLTSGSESWMRYTDANGYYYIYLDESYSPVEVTVSAPENLGDTETGVVLTGLQTTTVDFDLRLLQPCVGVSPDSLSSTQESEQIVGITVTITNMGAIALTWHIEEAVSASVLGISQERALPTSPPEPELLQRDYDAIPLADVILDGSFEAGTPNSFWDEFSSNFGTPLCTQASCGGGPPPHTGIWHAWFGGTTSAETGSVDQNVIIPVGTAELRFWLLMGAVSGATGFLEASIDNNVVFSVTEADVGNFGVYTEVTVDVSAYADGNSHNLKFLGQKPAGPNINFFVDDVVLDSYPPCTAPSDVMWLSITPASGSTAADSSNEVTVTFDSTGLLPGTFEALLCLFSNDLANSLVEVPVIMHVVENYYAVSLNVEGDYELFGMPGSTVMFDLRVTNMGSVDDTFELYFEDNDWVVELSMVKTDLLEPGEWVDINAMVTIPAGAADGAVNVATVTAVSSGDATKTAQSTLTTTVEWYRIFMPLLPKS